MDSELFTIGGVGLGVGKLGTTGVTRDSVEKKDVDFAQVKLMRTWRWVGNALYWVLIFYSIILFLFQILPQGVAWWKFATKSDFTQKEGLQYLGASTNVTRDDTGWPSALSLDEQNMIAMQTAVTDVSKPMPTKATFVSEHMDDPKKKLQTPEAKLMASQAVRPM